MKRNIIIFAILSVSMLMTGCIKETLPQGSAQTQAQVDNSDYKISGFINAIPGSMMMVNAAGYSAKYGLQYDFGIPAIHLMTEAMLEDLAVCGEAGYFPFYYFALNRYMDDRYTFCGYFWDAYYGWIRNCNDAIKAIAGAENPDNYATDLGGVYAYRAMCYLDLARLFEPKKNRYIDIPAEIENLTVPIVDENTTLAMAQNNPRVPRQEMYNFILNDLKNAEALLADKPFVYSEPTLAAVYGLYARTYLEMGYWTEGGDEKMFKNAADYARKAIEASGCTPLTQAQWEDSSNGFNNGAMNNAWIWGLKLSSDNTNNLGNFTAMFSSEALWGYPQLYNPCVSVRLYEQISGLDFRKYSWIDPAAFDMSTGLYNPSQTVYDYKFAGSTQEQKIFLHGSQTVNPVIPYQSIKFRPAGGKSMDDVNGGCADHPIMRVEEMHFIEMEAKAQMGEIENAKRLLEDFMDTRIINGYYSCTAGSKSEFINEMFFQKRVEFWGEGVLFYDYKRLDKGITRQYEGTNHPSVWAFNSKGRSPQWNIVITRLEYQNNEAITTQLNNPDPSGALQD